MYIYFLALQVIIITRMCISQSSGKTWPWRYYLPNPSARAGYDTRSIFKRSLTGLNSEFSFSSTSCLNKAEEPSPSYYLPIAGGRIRGSYLSQGICPKGNIIARLEYELTYYDSAVHRFNHYTTRTPLEVTVSSVKNTDVTYKAHSG